MQRLHYKEALDVINKLALYLQVEKDVKVLQTALTTIWMISEGSKPENDKPEYRALGNVLFDEMKHL
ncbi:MAG: hypothetical protein M1320_02830 [Patescibacteria group bacterium]|nr:hypothetical protein [Patescibacteria group bacterium]